jgi:hypothetical protein
MVRQLIAQTEMTVNGRAYRPGEVVSEVGLRYREAERLIRVGGLKAVETPAPAKPEEPDKKDSGEPQAEGDGKSKAVETPRDKQQRSSRTK